LPTDDGRAALVAQGVPYDRPIQRWASNSHHPPVKVVNGVPRYVLANPRQRHRLKPLSLSKPTALAVLHEAASSASMAGMRGSSAAMEVRERVLVGVPDGAAEPEPAAKEAEAEAEQQLAFGEPSFVAELPEVPEQHTVGYQGLYEHHLYEQKRRRTPPNLRIVMSRSSSQLFEPLDSWAVPQSRGTALGGDDFSSYVNQPPSRSGGRYARLSGTSSAGGRASTAEGFPPIAAM
jgi:hypothetical protein